MAIIYDMAIGLKKRPQADQERTEASAISQKGDADEARKVCARRRARGMWLCAVRAPSHGAAQNLQGQESAQVLQEAVGHALARQAKARGDGADDSEAAQGRAGACRQVARAPSRTTPSDCC